MKSRMASPGFVVLTVGTILTVSPTSCEQDYMNEFGWIGETHWRRSDVRI
ncbi:MAG: hypothetical protein JSU73_13240 [candidate division WOR-3 bacterium]|nr:MAG: hypothetical protein JSU73_13240 [candidate division WOR-3 bacterium]